MKKKGFPADLAIRLWLHEQLTTSRIADEFPKHLTIHYEQLCDAIDDTLGEIHEFVGVPRLPAPADFKSVEHHILGNEMRLRATDAIAKDSRWTRELTVPDLDTIARACRAFRRGHGHHTVAEIIARYGCDTRDGSRAPADLRAKTRASREAPRA